MNKNEFSALVAEKTGLTKKDTLNFVNVVCEEIVNIVKKDGELKLTNLGTFKSKTIKARVGINPKTLEKVHIPEKKALVFKASKDILK